MAYDTPQDLKRRLDICLYLRRHCFPAYHCPLSFKGGVRWAESGGRLLLWDGKQFFVHWRDETPNSDQVVLDDGLFEVTLFKKPLSLVDLANGLQP